MNRRFLLFIGALALAFAFALLFTPVSLVVMAQSGSGSGEATTTTAAADAPAAFTAIGGGTAANQGFLDDVLKMGTNGVVTTGILADSLSTDQQGQVIEIPGGKLCWGSTPDTCTVDATGKVQIVARFVNTAGQTGYIVIFAGQYRTIYLP